jgi:hypothetical protein
MSGGRPLRAARSPPNPWGDCRLRCVLSTPARERGNGAVQRSDVAHEPLPFLVEGLPMLVSN